MDTKVGWRRDSPWSKARTQSSNGTNSGTGTASPGSAYVSSVNGVAKPSSKQSDRASRTAYPPPRDTRTSAERSMLN